MNNRERMISVFHNTLPDRVPFAMYSPMFRQGTCERDLRNNGFGIIGLESGTSLLAPCFFTQSGQISEVKNANFTISHKWQNGEAIEIHTYETPVGTISQHIIHDTFGGNHRVKHYVEKIEDYKVIKYITENTVFETREKTIRQRLSHLKDDGVLFLRIDRSPYQKLLIELAGAERFLIDLYTNKEEIEDLMICMEKRLEEQFSLVAESGAELIWLPDNITCDLTPPDAFNKYCIPYYKKIASGCKKAGKVFIVHLDGRLAGLKDLISEAEFDVVDSFSFGEMSGDLLLTDAVKLWKNKIINPNFPASLARSSRKHIEDYLDKVVNDFGPARPFILQISEDIPLDTYGHVLPIINSYLKGKKYTQTLSSIINKFI